MPVWIWIIIIVAGIIISVFTTRQIIRRHNIHKINYMLDALEDGEINFRFQDNSSFNRTLNRLRTLYERQRIANEQDSWTKLIRILTHEIMNTLAPIVSLSDALSKNLKSGGIEEEKILEGLDIIGDSSKNLIKFVGTYRMITGISKPSWKDFDLGSLVSNVLRLNGEELASNNISAEIKIPNDFTISADEVQMNQIFQNLIRNSIQAGSHNIEITARKIRDNSIIINFKNDGEMIPSEIQEMIFVPFYTTKKEGTGIGLSVCRQIMKQHNGSISLQRSTPKETIFEIQIG